MNRKTIDHSTLLNLVETGMVHDAHVIGNSGGWFVAIRHRGVEQILTAQRSGQFRLFRRMDTLASYLKDLGIERFDVDASGYSANVPETRARPDRADALRRTHAAAEHDIWFRREVESALVAADGDDADWISNADAKRGWAEQRTSLSARASEE